MCDESGEAQKMEHVVIAHGSIDASGRGRKADELRALPTHYHFYNRHRLSCVYSPTNEIPLREWILLAARAQWLASGWGHTLTRQGLDFFAYTIRAIALILMVK